MLGSSLWLSVPTVGNPLGPALGGGVILVTCFSITDHLLSAGFQVLFNKKVGKSRDYRCKKGGIVGLFQVKNSSQLLQT